MFECECEAIAECGANINALLYYLRCLAFMASEWTKACATMCMCLRRSVYVCVCRCMRVNVVRAFVCLCPLICLLNANLIELNE